MKNTFFFSKTFQLVCKTPEPNRFNAIWRLCSCTLIVFCHSLFQIPKSNTFETLSLTACKLSNECSTWELFDSQDIFGSTLHWARANALLTVLANWSIYYLASTNLLLWQDACASPCGVCVLSKELFLSALNWLSKHYQHSCRHLGSRCEVEYLDKEAFN